MGKKILLVVVAFILLAAVPVTLFVLNKNQELRQKAAPATTLSFAPQTVTKKVGDEFSLDAMVDTGPNAIQEVLIEIQYDPTKVKALSLTNSASFPNIIASENITDNGFASIAVGTTSIAQPFTGSATAVTIRFQALAPTDTPIQIKFTDKSFISSSAEGQQNAIIGRSPSLVTITGSGVTLTTPSPTIQGTPTPTMQATSTPTSTPTGQLSPTPTVTPSGSPSGTLAITFPAANATVNSTTPAISGNAKAGSVVTLTISPGTTTGVVSANSLGKWTFTPTTPFTDGVYAITATATDPATGAASNTTLTFSIATGTVIPTPTVMESIESSVPVTGATEMTLLLITIGILLLCAGAMVPFLAR